MKKASPSRTRTCPPRRRSATRARTRTRRRARRRSRRRTASWRSNGRPSAAEARSSLAPAAASASARISSRTSCVASLGALGEREAAGSDRCQRRRRSPAICVPTPCGHPSPCLLPAARRAVPRDDGWYPSAGAVNRLPVLRCAMFRFGLCGGHFADDRTRWSRGASSAEHAGGRRDARPHERGCRRRTPGRRPAVGRGARAAHARAPADRIADGARRRRAGRAVLLLPKLAGINQTWGRLQHGDPMWLGGRRGVELLSIAGYAVLFRTVFGRGMRRLDWRASIQIPLAGIAAIRLIAAAGAGGVAVTAWALGRAGHGGARDRVPHGGEPDRPVHRLRRRDRSSSASASASACCPGAARSS